MKKIISFALVVLIIIGSIISFIIIKDINGSNEGEDIKISIKSGASLSAISDLLHENDIIKYPSVFKLISRSRYTDFKFGEYIINTGASYKEIAQIISGPSNVLSTQITIPEGTEIYKIDSILVGHISGEDFLEIANIFFENEKNNFSFLSKIPVRENPLEGYLFPDTYALAETNTAESLVRTMLKTFESKWTSEYDKQAEKLGMTQDEIIILASIIEREAASSDEMPKVSSVFHNRLKSSNYPYLQSCATVQYILKERKAVLSESDTKIDSPYNTYINKGLPIGPICSPGEDAIRAALYPEDTNYYFFVLGKNGKSIFSETYDEHQAAMRKNGL